MKKQGQSIVEYSLIAILVILGIVFMGPYVLRSIDAHFKLWDEGSQDSYQENLHQASLNVIPYMNDDCTCTQTNSESCGGPGLLCGANQHEVTWTCTPYQGCNGAKGGSTCVDAPDCCGCPQPSSNCGTVPLPIPNTYQSFPCPKISTNASSCSFSQTTCNCPVGFTYDSTNQVCTPPPSTTSTGNCYYGYRIYSYQCGSSTPSLCVLDPLCPAPTCYGSIEFPGSTVFCKPGPGGPGTPSSVGLNQNTAYNFVDDSSSCNNTTNTCQAYCIPPYKPNANPTSQANECILAFDVANNSCAIPPDFSQTTLENIGDTNTGSTACSPPSSSSSNISACCYKYNGGSCIYITKHGHGGLLNCSLVTNVQNFTVCSSGLPIASVIAKPGSPIVGTTPGITLVNGNVCGNPGMPGDGCNVDISWGNNNN